MPAFVDTAADSRTLDLPAGQDLSPLVADSMRDTVADLADAITAKTVPAAGGAAAWHTLEITVAAYASAALGRTVTVPLPADSPQHRHGVLGLRDLSGHDAVPDDSPVRRLGLFGLTPTGA